MLIGLLSPILQAKQLMLVSQNAYAKGASNGNSSPDYASAFEEFKGIPDSYSGQLYTGANSFSGLTATDCSFLITSVIALPLPGGGYQISLQANNQGGNHSWEVTQLGMSTLTESGPTPPCLTFPAGSSVFIIKHTVDGMVCTRGITIAPTEEHCARNTLTATVENCHFEAAIMVGLPFLSNPGFSYVITFGDGSPAEQSSASAITHTYPQPGTYEVCLTYIIPGIEGAHVTCCYTIVVSQCPCPEDVVHLTAVEPCTWIATLAFNLPASNFPITVDFGDGTIEIVNSSPVTHDYPDNTCYNVCYTYEPYPGDPIRCCEVVCLPACCLNPNFELNAVLPSESCLNPKYRISHVSCPGSNLSVTHTWVFSDGTVYEGPNPPDHLFTNFDDIDGEVFVTHTITCCDETASYTACASHMEGAYVGGPGIPTKFSDDIPSTNQKVLDFIYAHQDGGDDHPLIIEGTLIADLDANFTGGTWNMGIDAEIFVAQTTPFFRTFTLNGTTLRSAIRLPSNPGCCRWTGIRSVGRTFISVTDAWIMDAKYAIRYLYAPGPFPILSSLNTQYVNNYYSIKSEGQYVDFCEFKNNTMDGAPHPAVCGCNAVNAIDFREVGSSVKPVLIPEGYSTLSGYNNTILHYEQGFHFENTNLRVRGFDIYDLRDYQPVAGVPNNPDGVGAIGIDYKWSKSASSSLDMDYVHFSDFEEQNARSVAVRENISSGKHTLTAAAGLATTASTTSSIRTVNLAGGYDLTIGSGARLAGTISQNDISTNGGDLFGFGISGNFRSGKNILNVLNNEFDIVSNSTSALNGGVILSSLVEVPQGFIINDNHINTEPEDGAGIGITNAFYSEVKRNFITGTSQVHGILLREGRDATVDCNNIQFNSNGITVVSSNQNQYGYNSFLGNRHDMEFSGDNMGVNGSNIWWNVFNSSSAESLIYNNGAFTGKQHHRKYNSWLGQAGVEARHMGTASDINQSQFWYPSGNSTGSPNHPASIPPSLFASIQGVEGFPVDFCGGSVNPPDELPNPETEWALLLIDTAYWSGLTTAEQTFMRQEIYGLLLEHPGWLSTARLSAFKTAQEQSFVGQSESLKKGWQQLLQDISTHQTALEPVYAQLDSLTDEVEQLSSNSCTEASSTNNQSLLDSTLQQYNSLTHQLEQADAAFFQTVQNSASALLLQNAALDDSLWHTWCEKRYNEIALEWLAGTEPDIAATNDLRLIAQTCLSDGGRAVLGARGLCEVWLKEHYGEEGCQGTPQGRSAESAAPLHSNQYQALRIEPNPADNAVRIYLPNNAATDEQQVAIFTVGGQQVYSGTLPLNGELHVPVKGWQNGLYIAKVTSSTLRFARRFVVQHP